MEIGWILGFRMYFAASPSHKGTQYLHSFEIFFQRVLIIFFHPMKRTFHENHPPFTGSRLYLCFCLCLLARHDLVEEPQEVMSSRLTMTFTKMACAPYPAEYRTRAYAPS